VGNVRKLATSFISVICGIVVSILLLAWYNIATNYEYVSLAGTYVFNGRGTTCVLRLSEDRKFAQELEIDGRVRTSHGHWRRFGEAHVAFSDEFLLVPGEELDNADRAHGEFHKVLGIFPTLVMAPPPDGPKFARQIAGWPRPRIEKGGS